MKTSRLNREIVIKCAMDLVHESGIHGLRLNKIAERLDVKSPSLYTHTGSVTELRQSVVRRAMEEFREQLIDSLLGRAERCAFIELGKTWTTYANKHTAFYIVFYEKEYIDSYEKHISSFLRAAFERIFLTCDLSDHEVIQVERVVTNYFRGYSDRLLETSFDEADLVSDLEIIYNGILHNFTKVSQ
ncbi:TetR/AcrR family transcriptional regulator [Enterococcus sp. DIV0756]|uniref:TetR/AcrR family transcriptional regulator n=1 Tax=Enterococcus sp. DIV0756 TaxID=2774636 RepID=UPI003F2615E1